MSVEIDSTPRNVVTDIYSPCIMYVQYIGGCSVHRGVFSTSEGYHDSCGRLS